MNMSTPAHGLPDPVIDPQFYAGAQARRLAAFAVDTLAIAALSTVAILSIGLMTLGLGLLAAGPIWLTTGFLYRWLSIARWSATPGMRLTGVELRRLDGEVLDEAGAILHTAAFFGATLFALPQIASVALMATSPDGRGLHDRATGVALINRPA